MAEGLAPPAGSPRVRDRLVSGSQSLTWLSLDRGITSASRSRARFRAVLLAGNVGALVASTLLARLAGFAVAASALGFAAITLLIVITGAVSSSLCGLYSRDEERADYSTVDDLSQILQVAMVVSWAALIALWLSGTPVSIGGVVTLLGATMALPLCARAGVRFVGRRVLDTEQTTVIVGAGAIGLFLARKLTQRPGHRLRLVGIVDDEVPASRTADLDIPILGTIDALPELVAEHEIDRVLVAFTDQSHPRTMNLIRSLRTLDVQVDVVPRLFDVFGPNVDVHTIDGLPLLTRPRASQSRAAWTVKRVIDVALASIGLILLSPLLVAIALLVRLDSDGPAIYWAPRVGRDATVLKQLKFRTMASRYCSGSGFAGEGAELAFERLLEERPDLREQYDRHQKLDPDPRVTRVGALLRRSSLDELPQLINVVRGELSLVGPRPVTFDELERYGEQVPQLLSIRPGLTGYWQINGRSALTYDERVRLDLAYVSSWSLKLDATILLRTGRLLMTRSGAV